MDWTDLAWLKGMALPPGILLPVALLGLALGGRRGRGIAAAALVLLWGLAAPLVADGLLRGLAAAGARADPAAPPPGAIVVLSGDYRGFAPEYGEATVGPGTLARLRHAAMLQRRHGLPLLASGGGTPPDQRPGLGEAMRRTLEGDFGVPVRWVEGGSRNTLENATASAAILREAGIAAVLLVTDASHMPRARRAFAAAGIAAIPAASGAPGPRTALAPGDLLPEPRALARSAAAIHEILGLIWYEAVLRWRGDATR